MVNGSFSEKYSLGAPERLALAYAAKEYLRRISVIWSSPLSDCNRVQATNQYALPVLRYLIWTQHWPLSELRDVDRAARKIIFENGGNHPASLTSLLYLPREKGGRGLRSVEHEYKITKIKSLLKLYQNPDQIVEAVREFEEHAMASGHQSLVKEAVKYAEELNITRQLDSLNPVCVTTEGKVVTAARAGNLLKQSQEKQFLEIAKDKKWQGKLFRIRWEDERLSMTSCFAWLNGWASCPTYTIAGMYELYEQLLLLLFFFFKITFIGYNTSDDNTYIYMGEKKNNVQEIREKYNVTAFTTN